MLEGNPRVAHNGERHVGTKGQVRLLNLLNARLSDDYIAIHELMVDEHLDVDVIVIGPTGIWVLESKYFKGRIYYQDGEWRHLEKIPVARGGLYWVEKIYDKPLNLDGQWERERNAVYEALVISGLVDEHRWLLPAIKGGIAFTHPEIEIRIDASCPVVCLTAEQWSEVIAQERNLLPEFSIELQLEVADVLLDYFGKQLSLSRSSSVQLAENIYHSLASRSKARLQGSNVVVPLGRKG